MHSLLEKVMSDYWNNAHRRIHCISGESGESHVEHRLAEEAAIDRLCLHFRLGLCSKLTAKPRECRARPLSA